MRRRTTKPANAVTPDITNHAPEQLVGHVRTLLAEAQALSTRLATINEIAVTMQTSIDTGEMLRTMAQQARWVLDFQYCTVVTQVEAGYTFQVLHGASIPALSDISTLTERALRQKHALIIDTLTSEDGGPPGMQSALILPLRSANRMIGTLNFYARDSHRYTQTDMRIAYALALQVAAILQNEQLLKAVRRTRDELHTILDSISDGVLVLNRHGRIRLLNQALLQLLGRSDAEIIGQRALMLLRGVEEPQKLLLSQTTVRELWRNIQGHAQTAANINHTLALSNGRYVEWASAPLLEAGTPIGLVFTLRDVSARIELEQLRTDMTEMLVHDLRSPLSSVLMGLDLLHRGITDDDDGEFAQVTLGHVRIAAERMLEQVNILLDVNKLETRRLDLDLAMCSAHMLVDMAIKPLLPIAQHNAQTIEIAMPSDLPIFVCDVRLVRRVLQNLLDNALKFTPSEGRIEVSAHIDHAQHSIEIAVRDSGPGVPQEKHKHIFEKYAQARQEDRWRGSGLGLTFCKLVVEAHGGQIGVRDAPERGSEFWLTLPLSAVT